MVLPCPGALARSDGLRRAENRTGGLPRARGNGGACNRGPRPPGRSRDGPAPTEKNGEIYVLYTSDIHCGIDKGFGLAGLQQVRDTLEAQGYATILVDDGDAIQGEPIGTLSEGEAMIGLMNAMHYDAAIPGNHEFDYGMDRFLELTEKANFPYISCNFNIGASWCSSPMSSRKRRGRRSPLWASPRPRPSTTPSPVHFQNEDGEFVYGFLQDEDRREPCTPRCRAPWTRRAEGAELVYVMGHCGLEAEARPWTYADIIEHTRGIDVFLDGHSHDTEQVVMKNMDGQNVTRSACGTKLQCIGYSHISRDGEVVETGIWSWPNKVSAAGAAGYRQRRRAKGHRGARLPAGSAGQGGGPYPLYAHHPRPRGGGFLW